MKKNTLWIVALAAFVLSTSAVAETIKTRSGQVYKDAEITKQDFTSITVSYSDGIATIPKEDLPADMQSKLGYTTIAERAAHEAEVAKNLKEAAAKEAAAKIEEDKQKKAVLASMQTLTQAAAGKQFYGKTREEIVAMFGKPVKSRYGNNSEDGEFELMSYEEGKDKETFFTIWKRDGFVNDGCFKGMYFHNPKEHYITADEAIAEIRDYQKRQEERAKVRAGAIELLKQLGGNK